MFADQWFGKRYYGNRYFGPRGVDIDAQFHPGGGFYRRPIKYVRDGKIVDLEPAEQPVELVEWPELSPAILDALAAGVPVLQPEPIDLDAMLDRRMGQMMIERQMQDMADDDLMALLLLS